MEVRTRNALWLGATIAVLMSVPAGVASAAAAGAVRPVQREDARRAEIHGGHDKSAAWMVASYRELQLRKRTDKVTRELAVEIRAGGDVVSFALGASLTVTRGSAQVTVDSADALRSLQDLLGTSSAVFALRVMLSELEPVSVLDAPEMSLLSTAAFVASLVGDTGAPQRLADRFVEKHRGLLRQVRLPSGNCWSAYSGETTAAWNDLQDCMDDANERDFFRAAYERIACNAVWLLRTESAWFEYLNCLSPLSGVSK
jgi:hypothetical protein